MNMTQVKETLRICINGHRYNKSSSCPVCPVCEQDKASTGFLSLLSAPARRALENNGILTPDKLSQHSEKEILKFHGLGPASLPILKNALKQAGLSFRSK